MFLGDAMNILSYTVEKIRMSWLGLKSDLI